MVPTELRNLRVSAKHIRRLRRQVVEMNDKERLTLPGLDPRRADLTVAGAVLLDTILQRLGAEDLTLCDLALREGLVLDYIRRQLALKFHESRRFSHACYVSPKIKSARQRMPFCFKLPTVELFPGC